MSPYRGSFNVSIGFIEASYAGPWSHPYFLVPLDCLRSWPLVRREVVSPEGGGVRTPLRSVQVGFVVTRYFHE